MDEGIIYKLVTSNSLKNVTDKNFCQQYIVAKDKGTRDREGWRLGMS